MSESGGSRKRCDVEAAHEPLPERDPEHEDEHGRQPVARALPRRCHGDSSAAIELAFLGRRSSLVVEAAAGAQPVAHLA